jgi:SAM-dependent methyltransferase
MTVKSCISGIADYLSSNIPIDMYDDIPGCRIPHYSTSMLANSYFFGHSQWSKVYFEEESWNINFKERWLAAIGNWDDKIVVDIGCGPGNVYATLGGAPRLLIGVDISLGALKHARQVGYIPFLADAQDLPFVDSFADIVVANATLHHCDDMAKVLAEAARLVRPNGLLITDLDPQSSARKFSVIAQLIGKAKFPLYWLIRSKHYQPVDIRQARLATETHRREPGDGVTPELYAQVLPSLGFTFALYPHNHHVGASVFAGETGCASWNFRLAQRLSGINPHAAAAAESIMCVARRTLYQGASS